MRRVVGLSTSAGIRPGPRIETRARRPRARLGACCAPAGPYPIGWIYVRHADAPLFKLASPAQAWVQDGLVNVAIKDVTILEDLRHPDRSLQADECPLASVG
jgi:hypothetical protein